MRLIARRFEGTPEQASALAARPRGRLRDLLIFLRLNHEIVGITESPVLARGGDGVVCQFSPIAFRTGTVLVADPPDREGVTR